MRASEFIIENSNIAEDYMAGQCHVMALALKRLHPNWQLRARIGWDDDSEDDEYRVDHVYIVDDQGHAWDCRGEFDSEAQLLGPDNTHGQDVQTVELDDQEIAQLVQRGELRAFTDVDIQKAIDFAQAHDDEQLNELTFMGMSPCTKDCSGHRAGYAWSKARGGVSTASQSNSFNKGAEIAKAGY